MTGPYHRDVAKKVAARYPLPGPLTLRQLDTFLGEVGDRYEVRWTDHSCPDEDRRSGGNGG